MPVSRGSRRVPNSTVSIGRSAYRTACLGDRSHNLLLKHLVEVNSESRNRQARLNERQQAHTKSRAGPRLVARKAPDGFNFSLDRQHPTVPHLVHYRRVVLSYDLLTTRFTTMKRTFHTSFVQDSDNSTTTARSFLSYPATQATQASSQPTNTPANKPSDASANYILTDYEDGHNDFQSNVCHKPIVADSAPRPWPKFLPAYPRGPLVGLGIIFDTPPDTVRVDPPSTAPILAPYSHTRLPYASRLIIPGSIAEESFGREQENIRDYALDYAYSLCPALDYAAPLPVVLPPSPADFLMLDDSPIAAPVTGPFAELAHSGLTPDSKASLETPVVGLFADANLRTSYATPTLCVNPVDVTDLPGDGLEFIKLEDEDIIMSEELTLELLEGPQAEPALSESPPTELCYPEVIQFTSLTSPPLAALPAPPQPDSPDLQADFPEEALSTIVTMLADCVKHEREQSVIPEAPRHPVPAFAFASRTPHPFGASEFIARPIFAPIQPRVYVNDPMTVIQRSSPPLKAYQGVSVEDLQVHVDKFRQLNPGCELDKTFFEMFAGRFSVNGDPISEFRCYVSGCNQSNKRRDHILVHVGAHVQHRPYQCDEWYVLSSLYFELYSYLSSVVCASCVRTNARDTCQATLERSRSLAQSAIHVATRASCVRIC